MVFRAYVVEVVFLYLFLCVVLYSLLLCLREVILLFIFLCKCWGWKRLYEEMIRGLSYKYKRKYFHTYEGTLPKEEE